MERLALLAIDTSSEYCSVAVCLSHPGIVVDTAAAPGDAAPAPGVARVDDARLGVRCFVAERQTGAVSSTWVLPAVDLVLTAAGLTLHDCGALAFSAGPGSFTGLRTATGVAQGLAFGAGLKVLPVNTLMACAEAARHAGGCATGAAPIARVFVAIDARMSECYSAAFEADARGDWQQVGGNRVGPPEAAVAPWTDTAPYAVVGNAVTVFGTRLAALAGAARSDAHARPGAAALAAIGWRAWHAGQGRAPAAALPDYVRDKVALTTREREVERARRDDVRATDDGGVRADARAGIAVHAIRPSTDA
ncbi:MAG: tRNA (adenosine(37)-N6)-threonylcarbamoyltransferase complex dimerization subunit type 1 TsaB [Janthinobacterium lividum]